MKKFGMTFAKNRTYGVPEFAGTEVNRRSGKLKGLMVTGNMICEMLVQVPREALEIAGTSIKFRSGKFGYSICPTIRGSHADFFCRTFPV